MATVKKEMIIILSEGVSSSMEIDTLWKQIFSDSRLGPCAMVDDE
jgi:hypothetical protein